MSDPQVRPSEVSGLDAEFGRRLDLWGSYQRIGVALVGVVVALVATRDALWVQLLCSAYLTSSLFVPWLVRAGRSEPFKARVRVALMLGDLLAVSALTYGWGTHASPAAFLYLPIVVGFTLVPQAGLGRLALVSSLLLVGAALALEALEVLPYAPLRIAQVPSHDGSRLLFFALFAMALGAVQGGVESTVARMHEHALAVTRLSADRERREREVELAAQFEEAARLESLGRLSGGIAHDFNNLLMALLGQAELARLKLHSDLAFVDAALADIERAAESGSALTAQLLDFASRRPDRVEVVELGQAVRGAEKLLTRLLRRTVKLELALCDEPLHVRIDPSGLERVLFNLAVNASDAMPEGGTLRLGLAREDNGSGSRALITVADQGTGIAPEDLPRIFEPFFTRKPRGKGTGLGLASVYGIVRQSHGEVDVESTVGKGTTFSLRFPLSEEVASDASAAPEQARPGTARILLVDDNELVRGVVRAQLESGGYAVKVAGSAEEASDLLAHADRFDLLISDVVMPRISGVELARRTRERQRELPILLVSGYAEELSAKTLEALDVRLLRKPFGTKQLLQAVQESLAGA